MLIDVTSGALTHSPYHHHQPPAHAAQSASDLPLLCYVCLVEEDDATPRYGRKRLRTIMPVSRVATSCAEFTGLERVHEMPPIYLVHDFLSAEECDELKRVGGPGLKRSIVVDGKAGKTSAPTRTSESCFLNKVRVSISLGWHARCCGFGFVKLFPARGSTGLESTGSCRLVL